MTHPDQNRLRFELILASALLAAGLFLLPAIIYWVGLLLLGPYGENAGMGTFYADFFGDLASVSARAWTIALGPLLLVSALRLVFLRRDEQPQYEDANQNPAPQKIRMDRGRRVEPRVSAD